jgi:hypothetical protein
MKSQKKNNLKKNNLKMKSQKKKYSKKNYSRKNKRTKKNVKKISRTKKMSGGVPEGSPALKLRNLLKDIETNPTNYENCNLSNQKFVDSTVVTLCTILSKNTNLEELNISNNNFTPVMLKQFIDALKINKSIKTLNMRGTVFDDNSINALANALDKGGNTTLESLDISNSVFPSKMIDSLFSILADNKNLKIFKMTDIDFDRTSDSINDNNTLNEESLENFLVLNDTLETLDISNCNIKNVAEIINNSLASNKSLNTLIISDNVISDEDKNILKKLNRTLIL